MDTVLLPTQHVLLTNPDFHQDTATLDEDALESPDLNLSTLGKVKP